MKQPLQTVMGHTLPEPRLTPLGIALLVLVVSVPVLVLGTVLDLAVQWLFGWCVGLWCFV
jgi:hypothetical protein